MSGTHKTLTLVVLMTMIISLLLLLAVVVVEGFKPLFQMSVHRHVKMILQFKMHMVIRVNGIMTIQIHVALLMMKIS